jgi:hypothetical protein
LDTLVFRVDAVDLIPVIDELISVIDKLKEVLKFVT